MKYTIFAATKYLKGIAIERLFVNYMHFFVFLARFPQPYADLLSMLSDCLCKLSEPLISRQEIESIYYRVIELLSVMEGMFPPSEAQFVRHEMAHLAKMIKAFGPLRNYRTLNTERFVEKVKDFHADGGTGFYKTQMSRTLRFEKLQHEKMIKLIRQRRSTATLHFVEDLNKNNQLYYSDFRYYLCKKNKDAHWWPGESFMF